MLGKHLTADMCWQEGQAALPEGWNRSFLCLIPWMQAGKEGGSVLPLRFFFFSHSLQLRCCSGELLGHKSQKPRFYHWGVLQSSQGWGGSCCCLKTAPCYGERLGDDPEYQHLYFKHGRNQPLEGDADRREKTPTEVLRSAC